MEIATFQYLHLFTHFHSLFSVFSVLPKKKPRTGKERIPQPKNTVAMLNELRHGLVYKLESQTGPVHAPLFTISVEVSTRSLRVFSKLFFCIKNINRYKRHIQRKNIYIFFASWQHLILFFVTLLSLSFRTVSILMVFASSHLK